MTTLDQIATIEGSVREGGWKSTGNIYGDADRLAWYQEVSATFDLHTSSGWEVSPRIAFSGHLMPDRWEKTFQSSVAPWTAFTAQEFLKRGEVQGVFFKAEASPANDHQITNMTYAHIVQHLLGNSGEYGHCNLVEGVWDEGFLQLDIDTANSVQPGEHLVREGNFWFRLKEMADIENYLLYVSKDNTLHYVPHPMFGTLPMPVMTITNSHLLEPLRITPRNTEEMGQLKLQGTTPAGIQITAVYPTDPTPGPIVTRGGYKASDTTGMQTVASRQYLYENRPFDVVATMPGAVGLLFEIMDRIAITYTSSADGIAWSAAKFWIEEILVTIERNFQATTQLTLGAENAS